MESLRTLYLIDDDTDDLDFFCEAVNTIDKRIICFKSSDSASALKAFQNHDVPLPDIIFLDLNMPLIDGRTFLTELKKVGAYADVPVIIYSTSSSQRDVEETRLLGAADFLTKPCSQENLVSQLQQILEQYSRDVEVIKVMSK
ncbi:MAG TPA: response regulator [Ohtaekwangia sp.]|nr:response regulator [Ohtaekwangia sp.]